jgi:hypothetical protein
MGRLWVLALVVTMVPALPLQDLVENNLAQVGASLSLQQGVELLLSGLTASSSDPAHLPSAVTSPSSDFWQSASHEEFPVLLAHVPPTPITRYTITAPQLSAAAPRAWTVSCKALGDGSWKVVDSQVAVSMGKGSEKSFKLEESATCSEVKWEFSNDGDTIQVPRLKVFGDDPHAPDAPETPTTTTPPTTTTTTSLADLTRLSTALGDFKAGRLTKAQYDAIKHEVLAAEVKDGQDTKPLLDNGLITHFDYEEADVSVRKLRQATTLTKVSAQDDSKEDEKFSNKGLAGIDDMFGVRPDSSNITESTACEKNNGGCHPEANCRYSVRDHGIICACRPGWVGNGIRFCGLYNEPHSLGLAWMIHNPFAGLFKSTDVHGVLGRPVEDMSRKQAAARAAKAG